MVRVITRGRPPGWWTDKPAESGVTGIGIPVRVNVGWTGWAPGVGSGLLQVRI